MLDRGGGVSSGANNHFPRRVILPICLSVKPLSRRYLSKDIILVALDSLGVYLPSSSFVSLTNVCFFRDAGYLLSAARKSGNSKSTQKVAAIVQMNRTNANRASLENCIMHSFYTNCRETTVGAYWGSLSLTAADDVFLVHVSAISYQTNYVPTGQTERRRRYLATPFRIQGVPGFIRQTAGAYSTNGNKKKILYEVWLEKCLITKL